MFWDKFAFQYVYTDPKRIDGKRHFTGAEAKMAWDTFIYLKLKCPSIDVKDVLGHLESFMYAEEQQKEKRKAQKKLEA